MRTQKYRLTTLRLTPKGPGCSYEAWILASGRGRCVRGSVETMVDLYPELCAAIQHTYFILTGGKLEDADMH